jgi:hypothetical protein
VLRPLAAVCLLALALTGCGNEKSTIDELAAEPSAKTRKLDYPDVGMSLELPRNLNVKEVGRPGVFRAALGSQAVVSAFAYRRREQLPANERELEQALKRLERAAEKRSRSFALRDSRTTEVAGARAVELLGDQTLSQGRLRTRSLHVYEGKAEYVIELLAAPKDFERLDRALFGLIRRSLEVTGKVRPAES